MENLLCILEVSWEPRSSVLTICGSGIPRHRDEAIHFLGTEDRRWVTGVVPSGHSTITRGVVQVAPSTRDEPRRNSVGLGRFRSEEAEQCCLPTMNRNLTENVDRPWTGLVRLPSCFCTRVRSAYSETPISESVNCSPSEGMRGAHDVTIEKLHPGVDAQTLA